MSSSSTTRGRSSHTFQPPKGTRDFYPPEMAVRRYIESVWREVSINHGFDEIEGPTFEHLELYTVKSGEGIVSELFSFRREGGDTDYALRPEFTPTLARMYAARASSLPSPTRWFCIPSHFRAERPQRGRLREFVQWNVDVIGDASAAADADVIAVAVDVLRRFGLSSRDITIKISHRQLIASALGEAGVRDEHLEAAMNLLDRRSKLDLKEFDARCAEIELDAPRFDAAIAAVQSNINDVIAACESRNTRTAPPPANDPAMQEVFDLIVELDRRRILKWCEFDAGVVRGLAYYTGAVFEILVEGERAVAGGGRYDQLIELFGGPPTPAVGFAMGDVVLRLVLEDQGLLQEPEAYLPRPEVFVISSGSDQAEAMLGEMVSQMRQQGRHVRRSYRATRNVGKLLGEAARCRARAAVILGDELAQHRVTLKDLTSGEQRDVSLDDLHEALAHILEQNPA